MKKNIHLPLYLTTFRCIDCNYKRQTLSASNKEITHGSCSNCNYFYTGASPRETKVGAVEKYRQRVRKTDTKKSEK